MPVFTPQPKNTVHNYTLTQEDMRYILEHQNNSNREISDARVRRIVKDIRNNLWDFDFYEGKQIVVCHQTANVLSAQHRLLGMVAADVQEWSVTVHYVDRDQWLAYSIEKRTAADKLQMASSGVVTGELAKVVSQCAGQLPHIARGFASTSGAAGSSKPTEEQMLEAYSELALAAWEVMPTSVKANKKLSVAFMCLILSGELSLRDLRDCLDSNTRIGSARHWLVENVGFGTRGNICSTPYAIAVLVHANNTNISSNYLLISESCKPQYVTAGSYKFEDYR